MPSIQSTTALGAIMSLLGLTTWGGAVLGLSLHAPEARPWLEAGMPLLLLPVLGGVWLALGYALGWLSRPGAPTAAPLPPPAAPPSRPDALSWMSTEHLYLELEQLNQAALRRAPSPPPGPRPSVRLRTVGNPACRELE